jgi:hypothetical protein
MRVCVEVRLALFYAMLLLNVHCRRNGQNYDDWISEL